jgi:hypothetical protein
MCRFHVRLVSLVKFECDTSGTEEGGTDEVHFAVGKADAGQLAGDCPLDHMKYDENEGI